MKRATNSAPRSIEGRSAGRGASDKAVAPSLYAGVTKSAGESDTRLTRTFGDVGLNIKGGEGEPFMRPPLPPILVRPRRVVVQPACALASS